VLLALATSFAANAGATLYTFNFTNGFANAGAVPDGNTTGWFDTRNVSGVVDPSINDVNVSLNISGGFNGDFYAYLAHGTDFAILLNRPGRTAGNSFGYGNSGLNIILDDSAANGDIHTYQLVGSYSTLIANGSAWSPDGRNINPLQTLDTDGRTSTLSQFNGLSPNGDWTLFVADASGGGTQANIVSWGLNITAVPEPSTLGICVVGSVAFFFVR